MKRKVDFLTASKITFFYPWSLPLILLFKSHTHCTQGLFPFLSNHYRRPLQITNCPGSSPFGVPSTTGGWRGGGKELPLPPDITSPPPTVQARTIFSNLQYIIKKTHRNLNLTNCSRVYAGQYREEKHLEEIISQHCRFKL